MISFLLQWLICKGIVSDKISKRHTVTQVNKIVPRTYCSKCPISIAAPSEIPTSLRLWQQTLLDLLVTTDCETPASEAIARAPLLVMADLSLVQRSRSLPCSYDCGTCIEPSAIYCWGIKAIGRLTVPLLLCAATALQHVAIGRFKIPEKLHELCRCMIWWLGIEGQ